MARLRIPALLTVAAILLPTVSACSKTAGIEEVYTALDGGGLRRRARFTTDSKAAYCVVEYASSRPGATLEILIRQIALPDLATTNRVLVSVESVPERTNGLANAAVQFRGTDETTGELLDDDAPIPPGTYRCEARLDGELGGFAEFRVDYADCPLALIPDNSKCGGFFGPNKRCRKYGETSTVERFCSCNAEVWECDP